MIDVKKFISGFLILAVAAVCSGLILSYIGNSTSIVKTQAGPQIVGVGTTSTGALSPTFATNDSSGDSLAELQAELDTSSTEAEANDPNNLTATFANSLLSGFVAANPDGIQADASGEDNVTLPDSQSIATDIASDPALQNFKAPNWDTEWENEKMLVTNDNSTTSVKRYLDASQSIYQKYIGSTDIGSILGDENVGDAAIVSNDADEVIKATEKVPVPSSLMTFEARFIALLVYEKNYAMIVQNESNDPIKGTLTVQAEQPKYDLAINNFENEWQKAAGGRSFPTDVSASPNSDSLQSDPQTSGLLSFVSGLFGIHTAYAQWAVIDAPGDASLVTIAAAVPAASTVTAGAAVHQSATQAAALPLQVSSAASNASIFTATNGQLAVSWTALGKTIEKEVEDIALQITINTLTTLMQRKVLAWIQGSGAPRFVQDWGTELANSFTTAATNKLNSYMQCIPSNQAPNMKLLLTTPTTANTNACGAMFNAQLSNNLQNLQNHFSNFNNYLSLFQPGGNTWGLVMQVQDQVTQAGATSQKANTSQNTASQGWKGSSVCGDGSNPNGLQTVCVTSSGNTYPSSGGKCNSSSDTPTQYFNNGKCANGSNPQTTSPGAVSGQSFSASIKSGFDNITSAKNIAGILNALMSSLLNTLAQDAMKFSSSELNSALSGTSGGVSDSGLLGISSSTIAASSTTQGGVQCLPATQTVSLVSNTLTGEGTSVSYSTSNISSSTTAVSSGAPDVGGMLNNSSSQGSASFSAAGGAIDETCAAGGACPSTENSDGSPIYNWIAPGAVGNVTSTGTSFFATYNTPGTYIVTVVASTDNSTSTCDVVVQPALSE